jgi:hypothetical protein
VVTPEPTAEEKAAKDAAKVAAQAIALNKKVQDAMPDMTPTDRAKLLIDYRAVVVNLEAMVDATGTIAA